MVFTVPGNPPLPGHERGFTIRDSHGPLVILEFVTHNPIADKPDNPLPKAYGLNRIARILLLVATLTLRLIEVPPEPDRPNPVAS